MRFWVEDPAIFLRRQFQILTIEGSLNNTERVAAPPQMNPVAKAQREAKPQKQAGLIWRAQAVSPLGTCWKCHRLSQERGRGWPHPRMTGGLRPVVAPKPIPEHNRCDLRQQTPKTPRKPLPLVWSTRALPL